MKRNLQLHQMRAFFSFAGFWVPTIILFLVQEKHLSEVLAYSLYSAYSIGVIFLEVPTGIIADKYSRKLSVGLGYLFATIAFLSISFIEIKISMFIFIISMALSVSLISGASESLLYDTLDNEGQKSLYKKYSARFGMIAVLSAGIYAYIGARISELSLVYPMILSAIFYAIAAILTFLMKEPEISKEARSLNKMGIQSHLGASFKILLSKASLQSGLFKSVIIFSIFAGLQQALKYMIPQILVVNNSSFNIVGITSSFSLIAISLGAFILLDKVKKGSPQIKGFISVIVLTCSMLILLFIRNPYLVATILILISFALPIITTLTDQFFNDLISSEKRATLTSLRNMLLKFIASILTVTYAFLIGKFNITTGLAFLLTSVLLGAIIYISLGNKLKNI